MRSHLRFPAAVVALLCLCALAVVPAGAQDPGALREQAARARDRERSLSADVARLGATAARVERHLALLERRRAEVQADLERDRAKLAAVQADLRSERARLARLRARLAQARETLAERLVTRYKAADVDIASVVLGASSFSDLLERADFLKRIQQNDEEILVTVREARRDAVEETRRLARAEDRQRKVVAGLQARRNALASMTAAVAARREVLVRVRAARAAALRATRANRRRLEKRVRDAEAAIARAATAGAPASMPTGGWAIPWPIVQCESGGQNLPPNEAGASGYYQIMPATWRGAGGRGPAAYLAPKAEQDRIAAKLWNGGAGAGNWVCAGIVS